MTTPHVKHTFFDGLEPGHVEALSRASRLVEIPAGTRIFRQGEPHRSLFLINSGQVAIQAYAAGRGSKTIDTAGPGDALGWSWVAAPYRSHFDAVADEKVEAIAIDAEALRRMCEEDHELGYRVLERMVRLMEARLQATRLLLLDMYGTSQ